MKTGHIILIGFLLTACGASPEQLTATAAVAQAQTQTAAPTLTPTATSTPMPTATSIPTATAIVPAKIEGRVVGANGQPLSHVKLELLTLDGKVAETMADSKGVYTFENVLPGEYQVACYLDIGGGMSLQSFNEPFVVEGGQTLQQEFLFPT